MAVDFYGSDLCGSYLHDREFTEFLGYVENLVQNFNYEAQRGADCAL